MTTWKILLAVAMALGCASACSSTTTDAGTRDAGGSGPPEAGASDGRADAPTLSPDGQGCASSSECSSGCCVIIEGSFARCGAQQTNLPDGGTIPAGAKGCGCNVAEDCHRINSLPDGGNEGTCIQFGAYRACDWPRG